MSKILKLYQHNLKGYQKVKEAYDNGERVAGIVHATGTGKTYIFLQLCLDNPDKKILFVAPSNAIIEHIKEVIKESGLSLEHDFPNLEFCTYQSFTSMNDEDLENLDVDLLALDEFHHIGAPVWGEKVNTIVNTHPNMKVFGMTAYTVRDRGTPYERDMALSGGSELFSDKIVSNYDILDAMCDGVLPIPNYKSAYLCLLDDANKLEEMINKSSFITQKERDYYLKVIRSCKAQIDKAPKAKELIKQNLQSNDKCIYFCPLGDTVIVKDDEILGTNNISDIRKRIGTLAIEVSGKTILYETTSEAGLAGKMNREHFYNDTSFFRNEDVSNILRIMFAKNQYNEGVHAPGVNKVFLGRQTNSDIVFYEQIGRALSVKGNIVELTEEYEKKTLDELISIARSQSIDISVCVTKEEIIQRLLAPTIIDLVGNIDYIKDLKLRLKNRIKERRKKGVPTKLTVELVDIAFNIDVVNENIYETLLEISGKLTKDGWEEYFKLAEEFYKKFGHLRVPVNALARYITPNNKNLGNWISTQRDMMKKGKLSQDRIDRLNSIGMVWDIYDDFFYRMYDLAKIFKKENGHLRIPKTYVTKTGEKLGAWLSNLKYKHNTGNLDETKTKLLEDLGVVWKAYDATPAMSWDEWYELAKDYKRQFGDLNIVAKYVTPTGEKLGAWLVRQRVNYKNKKLTEEQIKKLEDLGIIWDPFEAHWEIMFKCAEKYYKTYGNLFVLGDYVTEEGLTLGVWLNGIRNNFRNGKLSQDKIDKLNSIGMIWDKNISLTWDEYYELARAYYLEHGNLDIDSNYVTNEGYRLGSWLQSQINQSKNNRYTNEKRVKLENIGLKGLSKSKYWTKMIEQLESYYKINGNIDIPKTEETKELSIFISKIKSMYVNGELSVMDIDYFNSLGIDWELTLESKKIEKVPVVQKEYVRSPMIDLLIKYKEVYGDIIVPQDYQTDKGVWLGKWVSQRRILYKEGKLSKEEIDDLESLGMVWSYFDDLWNKMISLAKEYKKEHGDLMIPRNYVTSTGEKLGLWLSNCRGYYKDGKLSQEKIEQLEALGVVWDPHLEQWNQTFEKAKQYYLKHGNLIINSNTCTEEELSLKNWLHAQRAKYRKGKLTKEQIAKLESIGVSLEPREHKDKIIVICKNHSINYDINNSNLTHIDCDILEQRLRFFDENSISYVDSDGLLISDIFMSSKDFESKYGISINELIGKEKRK